MKVSKTLLHFVRTGQRPVSPKFERKLREAEAFVGLSAPSIKVSLVREGGVEFGASDPWLIWSKQLRAVWKRDPAKVELAIRAAWSTQTAREIIAWLDES